MSIYTETVKRDTPRLIVQFQSKDGIEHFGWGVIGQIPVLPVIGYLVRMQAELAFRSPELCDEIALVLAWDAESKKFSWFVHPDIPVDSLVGMLEVIKESLVASQMASVAAQQYNGLLTPDGRPMAKKPRIL